MKIERVRAIRVSAQWDYSRTPGRNGLGAPNLHLS